MWVNIWYHQRRWMGSSHERKCSILSAVRERHSKPQHDATTRLSKQLKLKRLPSSDKERKGLESQRFQVWGQNGATALESSVADSHEHKQTPTFQPSDPTLGIHLCEWGKPSFTLRAVGQGSSSFPCLQAPPIEAVDMFFRGQHLYSEILLSNEKRDIVSLTCETR